MDYRFPLRDVQSLVFSSTTDIITLRDGKVYTGQYDGPEMVGFRDGQGIDYQFPLRDVETLVFTQTSERANAGTAPAKVVPVGTEVVIRTHEDIDSDHSSTGQLFSAAVSEDVPDSMAGSRFRTERAQSLW